MLFMGQEFVTSSRFYYFTDHKEELGRQISEGRLAEFSTLSGFQEARDATDIPDPQDPQTFIDSKLNLEEREQGVGAERYALTRELLALRRNDRVLRRQDRRQMRAISVGENMLLVHMWHGRDHRLIVANFGLAVDATPISAGVPPELLTHDWRVVLSTEERRFGGTDDRVRFDAQMVSLPPQTVAWLAATKPLLPVRALRQGWRRLREARNRASRA
jgi:maltooligosyltrehalose trehalohydrolase